MIYTLKENDYEQLSLFDKYIEDTEEKQYKEWKWHEIKFNLEVMEHGNE